MLRGVLVAVIYEKIMSLDFAARRVILKQSRSWTWRYSVLFDRYRTARIMGKPGYCDILSADVISGATLLTNARYLSVRPCMPSPL